MSVADAEDPSSRLTELRVSARGWHGIQLAVIGFIGFCGVLQNGRPDNPTWLQVWAAILVLVALVLACLGTFLVGRVAWPLFGGRFQSADADLDREAQRLKRGLLLDVRRRRGAGAGHRFGLVAAAGGRGASAGSSSRSRRAVASARADRWVQASPGTLRVSVGRPDRRRRFAGRRRGRPRGQLLIRATPHQPRVPGAPLNGPTRSAVIQPP